MVTPNETGDRGLAGFKQLAVDVLSGWVFLALFLATNDIFLATGAALAAGVGQVIWMLWRKQKTHPMQWMATALVVGLGVATLVTRSPTFVVFKPSILEAGIASIMLWPGWIARYLPARRLQSVSPRMIVFWGYLHAAAWFACAASNLLVAYAYGLKAWAIYSNFAPLAVMGVLTGLGFLVFPSAIRRARERGVAFSSPSVG
jgi:intracellular septation protein